MALQFILGKSGSGKTTHVHDMIFAQSEHSQVILFVPEQFTFETEKALFIKLGAARFKNVRVTSFTRFCSDVFKMYGGIAHEYATEPAKAILMDMAVDSVLDNLDIYVKTARTKTFSTLMLNTVEELKNAGVTPTALMSAVSEESYLRQKTSELALIYEAYNALLEVAYRDPLDNLSRATNKLLGRNFFEDYVVFFDEFKGFTANENDILKLIFSTAIDCFVALCLDPMRADGVFSSVSEVQKKLMRFCREAGVTVKVPIKLEVQHRLRHKMLIHLEENLLATVVKPCDENDGSVTAMLCKNEYDEVEYVLCAIAQLVSKEGYKYNDIAIIGRDMDTYIDKICSSCQRLDIPFFSDNRVKVTTKPLVRFVKYALDCIINGYQREDMLGLLKCGFSPFSIEEICELENYCFVWDVKKNQWKQDFVQCPRGFSQTKTNEDIAVLQRINVVRSYVFDKLAAFQMRLVEATPNPTREECFGKHFCAAIIKLIEDFGLRGYTQSIISSPDTSVQLAQEYTRVWEILIEQIDTLAIVLNDTVIDAKRFLNLYNLVMETCDLGVLPQSLDCVIVGSADRIRISDKRCVFVIGVNENVFPHTPTDSGVFTDKEREELIACDLSLSPPIKDRIMEEQFIAYKTLCSVTDRLFLTARTADISGRTMAPSVIFYQLARMFGEDIISNTQSIYERDGEFFCVNTASAFSHLARHYYEDNELVASIKSVLKADIRYQNRIGQLDNIAANKHFGITDQSLSMSLFGTKMQLSATRVENFYSCAFRYFCEYGMKLRPLKRAELNPLEAGNLIHHIIHAVTEAVDMKNAFNEREVKRLIKTELDRYIDEAMGGEADKTSRFLYLYNRMRESLFKVIERLHIELVQSAFTPCDYEYEISEQSDVKPLKLVAQNGVTVVVSGKIDRIDSYVDKKGQKFIRIIDYKSGKKVFSLTDVLSGLNLQMLIYLFCIQNNGTGKYDGVKPAGILYMPASEVEPALDREATVSQVNSLKAQHYKMNGLILNDDEIIDAMDKGASGVFIPVTRNIDGTIAKKSLDCLASLKELSRIDRYINKLICGMADELSCGKIKAYPASGACTYCNYSSVCGKTSSTLEREPPQKEAVEKLLHQD